MPVKKSDPPNQDKKGHVRNRHPYLAGIPGCNCGCNLPLLVPPKP